MDNIVKRPVKGVAKIPEPNSDYASVRYRGYLTAAVERWKEYLEQLKPLRKKPVLFIMMNSTEDADDVAWLKKARSKPLHYRPLEEVLADLAKK